LEREGRSVAAKELPSLEAGLSEGSTVARDGGWVVECALRRGQGIESYREDTSNITGVAPGL